MGMTIAGDDAGTGIEGFTAYLRVDRVVIDRSGKYAIVRVSRFANKDMADKGKFIGQPVDHMVTDPEPAPVQVTVESEPKEDGADPVPETRYEMQEQPQSYTQWFSPEALKRAHKDVFAQAYEWLTAEVPQYKDAKLA